MECRYSELSLWYYCKMYLMQNILFLISLSYFALVIYLPTYFSQPSRVLRFLLDLNGWKSWNRFPGKKEFRQMCIFIHFLNFPTPDERECKLGQKKLPIRAKQSTFPHHSALKSFKEREQIHNVIYRSFKSDFNERTAMAIIFLLHIFHF